MIHNYEYIVKAISSLYESKNSAHPTYSDSVAEEMLRKELNKAFPDFQCSEVVYTDNFDKNFFGIMVVPCGQDPVWLVDHLLAGLSIINNDKEFIPFKFDKYLLEIDGRLIRDFHLTYNQIAALIIQEICAMNSTEPMLRLRNAIDNYICMNNTRIDINTIMERQSSIFYLVVTVTLHNITSLFTRFNFSVFDNVSDVVRDGLYEYFEQAYKVLVTSGRIEEVNTNMVLLSWYFDNYKNFNNSRDLEIMFRDAMKYEPSQLNKRIIKTCINRTWGYLSGQESKYYDDVVTESTKRKGLLYQMKRNGLKSIEEDLYEYNMRLRNVETQDDAILLMRQINSRMSILEEYLEEDNMDEKDKERWTSCYKRYLELREALSKKTVYNRKMYGLFVDYNALQQMNDNGNFMNTYY